MDEQLKAKISKIRCFITDVDGVLSNGLLYLSNQGDEIKAFHVHDGMGLKLLMCSEVEVAVITTSKNQIIETRMRQLNLKHYYSGQVDKRAAYADLKTKLALQDEQFAYIGDDLPDIAVMQQVGLKFAVNNARPEVKAIADYVTNDQGGDGAVREVCDLILNYNGKMQHALERYLNV